MSTFEVRVREIKAIHPIEGADNIEIAQVEGFQTVVQKGVYSAGDLCIYIPEASIVPEWVLAELGLEGRLAGKAKNRVKPIRLRKILSEGLVYPLEKNTEGGWYLPVWREISQVGAVEELIPMSLGDNVAEYLEITKWEPPVPACLSGEVCNIGEQYTLKYDIENLKYYPDAFVGKQVYITEKIHGTNMCIGYNPTPVHDEVFEGGKVWVCSKGLGAQGLVFKDNEKNIGNMYVNKFKKITKTISWSSRIEHWLTMMGLSSVQVLVYGELYGAGVQDLDYGESEPEFRVFDVYLGNRGSGVFLDLHGLHDFCEDMGLMPVEILYLGAYPDKEYLDIVASGDTKCFNVFKSSYDAHMREGVVVKTMEETAGYPFGRGILKHINPDYLTRKGNTTEFN